jgi:hypothetical protein
MATPPIPAATGLTPEQELAQWKAWRDMVDPQTITDPQASQYYAGPSPRPNDPRFPTNPLFSPAASSAYVNKQSHFDLKTGKTEKNKGFLDLPESYAILAMAGGMGGLIAGPAMAGIAAAHSAPAALAPEIASTTGALTGVAAPTAAGASAAGASGATTAAAGGGMGWANAIKTGLDWYNKGSGALSDIGQIAGNDAAAAAQGRGQQAQIQQGQDRNAIQLYLAQLAAAKQAMDQNSQLAGQAGHGDLMANVQDVQLNNLPASVQGRMPTLTGGLRPSVLGPNARQAGQTLSRNALLQLLQGPTNMPTAPTMTPMPDASGYDTLSKILGRTGSYAGAANPLFELFANQKKAPYQTVGPPMPPSNFDPEMG